MSELLFYLDFPFVRYAFIVGTLIALCSSLLGVTLVLKRYSFIGDGLSHVAFGAMCVATVLHMVSNALLVMPVTMLVAIMLLRTGKRARVKGDAAIAMLSVGALAFGYMMMNVFSASANVSGDVCSTLFGSTSILTLTMFDVILCIVLSVLVIGLFVLYYNRIFAVTFDEDFARCAGMNADGYNLLVAVIISVIVVLGMNLVGSLLISALVVFPALSAMQITDGYRRVVILSSTMSVFCAIAGLLISIMASTPVGSTIVMMDILLYAVCALIGRHRR